MFKQFFIAIIAVFATLAAIPASAAQIIFDYEGEVSSIGYFPHPVYSGVFVAGLFPSGTAVTANVVLEYNDDPATAVISSFTATLGASNFSMTAGSGQNVTLANDEPFALEIYDYLRLHAEDVSGPSFFGLSASGLFLSLEDNTASLFDSDTPTATELTAIATSLFQEMTIHFSDASGDAVARYTASATRATVTTVVSPVPLPAGLGLLASGMAGLGLLNGRKRKLM